MNQPSSCPPRQEYELLQAGAMLSSVQVERLTGHLEECARCAALVDTLGGEDTDLNVLREARPTASGSLPAAGLIADLCRLPLMADSSATAAENGTIENSPAAEALDLLAPAQSSGEIGRLGNYRVLRVVGAGGMGVVFEAEDTQLKRRVAIKAIRPTLAASAGAKRRFLREAQAVAALKHDHVVTVYQVGEDRGVPYLAMEYLEGESLSERLERAGKLDVGEAVRIGGEVAEGLAAAHEKGLVHRDIKPANIWLERRRVVSGGVVSGRQGSPRSAEPTTHPSPLHDSPPRVKILDFGLARGGDADTHITAQGAIVGTPAYMSPEQTRGQELDFHADLFSMGCVLYRMCTGQAPFQGKDSMSTLLAVATHQPTAPRQVSAEVPAALSELIMRLLNKDPSQRPASAQEVADTLRRLAAAPSSATAVARRPRWLVPAAAAVLLALLPLGYFFGGTVIRFATNKGEVIIETDDPDVVVTIAQGKAEIYDRVKDRRFVLEAGEYELKVSEPDGPRFETKQFQLTRGGSVILTAKLPPLPPPPPDPHPPTTPTGGEPLSPLALVAAPAKLPGVKSWTIETVAHRDRLLAADDSPDGKLIAAGGLDGVVRLWDRDTGKLVRALAPGQGEIRYLAWLPDSQTLAVGASPGSIGLWDTRAGRMVRTLGNTPGEARMAALSADGQRLAIVLNKRVELWDVATGKSLGTSPEVLDPCALSWSPNGATLAIGCYGGEIALWTTSTLQQPTVKLPPLAPHGKREPLRILAWSADGQHLAGAGYAGAIGIWNAASRQLTRTLERDSNLVKLQFLGLQLLEWMKEDRELFLTFTGRSAKIDATSGKSLWIGPEAALGNRILAYGHRSPGVNNWFATTSTIAIATAPGSSVGWRSVDMQVPPQVLAWSRQGDRMACGNGVLSVWEPGQGKMLWNQEQRESSGWGHFDLSAAFSPDGTRLATGSGSGHLSIHDVNTGQRLIHHQAHMGQTQAVDWSADGKWIATAGRDKVIRVWQADPFREVASFEGHDGDVRTLAWAPDSSLLASGSIDGTVRVWDLAGRKAVRTLKTNSVHIFSVAWSPDGARLAAAGNEPLVHLWSATGEPLPCRAAFPNGTTRDNTGLGTIRRVAWSTDGRRLACAWRFGHSSARLFDVQTWELRHDIPDAGGILSPDLTLFIDRHYQHLAEWNDGYRLCETATGRCLGSIVPLRGDKGFAVEPSGHYRSSRATEKDIVYIVQTDAGQETLTPAEFAKRFGWKNDPEHVRLMPNRGTVPPTTNPPAPTVVAAVLDSLDPAKISAEERFDWQPKELVAVLGSHRWRHWHSVADVSLSPDGKLVASAGAEGRVVLRETATGKELANWEGMGVQFAPDGASLAVLDEAGVRLLNTATLAEQARFPLPGRMAHPAYQSGARVVFSRDGKTLAALNYAYRLCLWELATGKERLAVDNVQGWSVALSRDAAVVAVTNIDEGVSLWDTATGQKLPACPQEYRHGLALSADGRLLAASSVDHTVRLWDVKSGKQSTVLKGHSSYVYSMLFAPDDQTLISASSDGTVRFWDMATHKERLVLAGHKGGITTAAISSDAKTLATGGHDRTVRLWDVGTKKQLHEIRGFPHRPDLLSLTPDGKTLVVGGMGYAVSTVMLWDVPRGELRRAWDADSSLYRSAMFADGKTLATAGAHGVQLWDLPSGEKLPPVRKNWTSSFARAVRVSSSGVLAAMVPTQVEGKFFADVELANPTTGALMASIRLGTDPGGYAHWLAISPDAKLAAVQGEGSGIQVWDVAAGRRLFEHQEPPGTPALCALDFSATGKTLLSATGGRGGIVRLWDTATGQVRHAVETVHVVNDGLACAILAADDIVISAGYDGRIIRWTAPAPNERLPKKTTLAELPGPVHQLALTADGRYLFTANGNGTVYVLRLVGSTSAPQPTMVATDRGAAEWVLAAGGRVNVKVGDGARWIDAAKELPAEPFTLVRAILTGCGDRVTDPDLARFVGLSGLTHLYVAYTSISDAGLEHVKRMSGLVDLYAGGTRISDAGLAKLASLPNLTHLALFRTRVSGSGLEHLRGMSGLVYLDLALTPVGDAGVRHLRGLAELSNIDLSGTQVTDECLKDLQSLPKLAQLALNSTEITNAGLSRLVAFPALTTLGLNGTNVTDADLDVLKRFTVLKSLAISQTAVTDAGLERLQGRDLTSLAVSAELITDLGLENLKKLSKLTELHVGMVTLTLEQRAKLRKALPNTRLTLYGIAGPEVIAPAGDTAGSERRAALWALSCGGSVVVQNARGTSLPVANAKDLPAEDFALLRILLFECGDKVTDQGLENVKGLRHLTHLHLRKTSIKDAGLSHVAGVTTLVDLFVSDTQISDAGLAKLKGLARLEQLSVYNTRVTDAGLQHAAALQALTFVDLNNQPITDAGIAALARLPKLRGLGLASTKITNKSLAILAAMPHLDNLDLGYTALGDSDAEVLKDMKGLVQLNVSRTQITDLGLKKLTGLTRLTSLGLSERQATDAGLESIKAFPKLATLAVVAAQLSDASLEHLRALPALTELHVHMRGMPQALEQRLRRALPKCKVVVVR